MQFIAIMAAEPNGRIAKVQAFETKADADAHVALFDDRYPDAFTAPEPAAPDGHWLVDIEAKTIAIVPPPPPEPRATGAQMIDEAERRNKLHGLLAMLTSSERAMLYTRRRIVAGSPFAEVLRGKLGVGGVAMAKFIAAAAVRRED